MQQLVYFDVFDKYSESHKTLSEAIHYYQQINTDKMKTILKLQKYQNKQNKYFKKLEKIEMLSIQESLYFKWIKQRYHASYTVVKGKKDIRRNSESSTSTSDSPGTQNGENMFEKNIYEEKLENEDSTYIANGPGFNYDSSISARQSPPTPSPLQNAAALSQNSSMFPELKVRKPFNARPRKGNRSKRSTPPCTPSSEEEEITAFEVPPAPIVNPEISMMTIPTVLMQSYPLPVRYTVIEEHLQTKYGYKLTVNEFDNYDYMDLNGNGYVYIYPPKLQKLLSSEQKERIMKNKLYFLSNSIYKNGIETTGDNVNCFFEHYIGWIPSNEEHQFLYKELQNYRKLHNHKYGDENSLQDILSYEDLLCCTLQSVDYEGCSKDQFASLIQSKLAFKLPLQNPYIKQTLDGICDPNAFRKRGRYKLGVKTRKKKSKLLKWWCETYEKQVMEYDEKDNANYGGNDMNSGLRRTDQNRSWNGNQCYKSVKELERNLYT